MASEMAGDRKVLCVFEELKQLAVDNNFEPTNPLTELLAEFACEGGLLDQEGLILAHLLTRFTHQRLREIRRLLEIQQGRWNAPFIDGSSSHQVIKWSSALIKTLATTCQLPHIAPPQNPSRLRNPSTASKEGARSTNTC